jgi:hypothetical protein
LTGRPQRGGAHRAAGRSCGAAHPPAGGRGHRSGFLEELIPSARGESEITDLNNIYVREGTMRCETLEGYWIDAGTSHDELPAANVTVAELSRKGAI